MGGYAMPVRGTMQGAGGGSPGNNQFFNNGPTMQFPGNSPSPGYGGGGYFAGGGGSPFFNGPGGTSMPANAYEASGNPYQVPSVGPISYPWGTGDPSNYGAPKQERTANPGSENLGHGIIATGLQYPGLSQDMANYLMSQVGAGVAPYNLSTMLPTGGQTAPGQLTAGLNPLMQQMMNFFQTGQGGSMPGMSQLANIANNGISALPEWQSMIAAQQQNIGQNQADLAEQYGSMGNLAGSGFGNAMSNYMAQTTTGQNALLGQLQQQNILQGQLPAIENLFSGSQQFGGALQSLDQQAIQNQLQQFLQSQPQFNPMIGDIMGMSTLFPPTNKTPTTSQMAMDWANTGANVYSSVFG